MVANNPRGNYMATTPALCPTQDSAQPQLRLAEPLVIVQATVTTVTERSPAATLVKTLPESRVPLHFANLAFLHLCCRPSPLDGLSISGTRIIRAIP